MENKTIAIFASGRGSNATMIIENARRLGYTVGLLVCNNTDAPVVNAAENMGIPALVINKKQFQEQEYLLHQLDAYDIQFIALAGFLWLIPKLLIARYPNRIINIHPSLLPKYGGKGMYGMNVHKEVLKNGDKQTGITIHLVNEIYDSGAIIEQVKVNIEECKSAEEIAEKVLILEHKHYSPTIARYINNFS